MATTAKNTTTKNAAQRAKDQVLNGHDKHVEDVEIKNKEASRAGARDGAAAPEATKIKESKAAPTETQYAYAAYCNALGVQETPVIEFKNMVAGFLASIVAMVFGYAVGMTIVDILAYGVFLLTGWAYLALAVYIVGMVITLVSSIYLGGKVAQYIGTGAYTKDIERVGAWFKNKFSSNSDEEKRNLFNMNKAAKV